MNMAHPPRWIIIGLGNPGREHELNRHNAGFMCVDALAKKHNINTNQVKFDSLIGCGEICNQTCLLMKPLTYMNHSGVAVLECLNSFDMDISQLIVVLDDISFLPGNLRVRKNGSAGGHKGLNSVIESVSTQDFMRIRIGVGQPPKSYSLEEWVVTNFDEIDMTAIRDAIEKTCDAIDMIINGDIDKAMSRYNRLL